MAGYLPRVRHQIPVLEDDGTGRGHILCSWQDCANPASSLHTSAVEYGAAARYSYRPRYAFCSARCKDWWDRAHRPGCLGRSSPGVNPRYYLT
jgi:hypothetical protein